MIIRYLDPWGKYRSRLVDIWGPEVSTILFGPFVQGYW